MSLLSIIGTGAALLNYKKAKQEYEELLNKKATLEAAVNTYQENKSEKVFPKVEEALNTNEINFPDGLSVTSILKVANLAGRIFWAKPSLVITNETSEQYTLYYIEVVCSVFGEVVGSNEKFTFPNPIEILPNETVEISAKNKSLAGFANEETLDKLRKEICAMNGKSLITSCGKTNIEGIETARISFQWKKSKDTPNDIKNAEWIGKPGVLRYCMELSLIGE